MSRTLRALLGRARAAGTLLSLLTLPTLLALAAVAPPAQAVRKVQNYPKVALYTLQVGQMSDAKVDTLSWYDLVVFSEGPENLARVRSRNSDIELFFGWMPQNIVKWSEGQTFWHPDTSWSLIRLSQFYAQQNDWYLRDVNGARIAEWDGYAANWTRYCPPGIYGTSKGLTYVEWLVQVAIPQITKANPQWTEDWGRGSSSYTGVMLEILADCVGSYGWPKYQFADPDRDGLPEGVDQTCSSGGWADSLSVLFREQNEVFHDGLYGAFPPDMPVLINAANKWINPVWWTDTAGVKLESWMSWPNPTTLSWHEWMYGLRDWSEQELWGPGYEWSEWYVGHEGLADEGWDHTLLQVWARSNWSTVLRQRMKRFGLGTALLGDGYFMYTMDQLGLFWQSEYEWDFGAPLGHFTRETFAAAATDTLYVRLFEDGFVEVNPNATSLAGVAAEDARFGFWSPVDDLSAEALDATSARVSFSAPGSPSHPVGSTEVRYAYAPLTTENWESAFVVGSLSGSPGAPLEIVIGGLVPGSTVHVAVRNRVHGRLAPALQVDEVVLEEGGPPADLSPPAPIDDLAAAEVATDRVRLTWSAVGDDGENGTADHYLVRRRVGGPISSESLWSTAVNVTAGIPSPGTPGAPQALWNTGLAAATTYGFSVRAVDESGNLAPLSAPLVVTTDASAPPPPPPDPDLTPPAAVSELEATGVGTTWIDLAWTAPGDDGQEGQATTFLVRFLEGSPIDSESRWTQAAASPDPPPLPGAPGSSHTFRVRVPDAGQLYGLAVRARDEAGNLGPLPAPLTAETAPEAPPPDVVAPGAVNTLHATGAGQDWVMLEWTAPGDDGEVGRATSYEVRSLLGRGIGNETQWTSASPPPDPVPIPADAGTAQSFRFEGLLSETLYGFAVRARDEVGHQGPLPALFVATTASPPHPPAAITSLQVAAIDSTAVTLRWGAPDDGEGGAVAAYQVGVLAGEPFTDATDWEHARLIDGPPIPAAPGTVESLVVPDLEPSTLHGFAVRSWDAGGLPSPLSNFVSATTLDPPSDEAPPDTTAAPPTPVQDLSGTWSADGEALLVWSAPAASPPATRVDRYILLSGRDPLSSAGLRAGTEIVFTDSLVLEGRVPRPPGAPESLLVADLAAGCTHHFALVSVDDRGARSVAGAPWSLPAPPAWPDRESPAAIRDLAAVVLSPTRARLEWTEVGDDGGVGSVARYVLGVRSTAVGAGESTDPPALSTEDDWAAADTASFSGPAPDAAGRSIAVLLTGLDASTGYGVAVRARDEAGRLSPLGVPVSFTTPSWPDTLPPHAVSSLSAPGITDTSVLLTWLAPRDSVSGDRVDHHEIAWRLDGSLHDEIDWALASKEIRPDGSAAAPGEPESFTVEGLPAETAVTVSVRAVDRAGLRGAFAPALVVHTLAVPDPPDPPIDLPPAPIADLAGTRTSPTGAELSWTAVGADSLAGRATRHVLFLRAGALILSEPDLHASVEIPLAAPPDTSGTPQAHPLTGLDPSLAYGVALFAIDAAGLRSALVPGAEVARLDPEPPLPPVPIVLELAVESVGVNSARLTFRHPNVQVGAPALSRYEVRWSPATLTEESFPGVDSTLAPPPPGPAGEPAWVDLRPLPPDAALYAAVRTWDEAGRASALSEVVSFRTLPEEDSSPPAPPSGVAVTWDGESLELEWSPSSDARVSGYRVHGRTTEGAWRLFASPTASDRAIRIPREEIAAFTRLAVSAHLANGEESARVEVEIPRVSPAGGRLALQGPFPHPMREHGRFRITLPEGATGPVELLLRDVTGRVRRRLSAPVTSTGEVEIAWDRRDLSGDRCGGGFYYAIVIAGRSEIRSTIFLAP